MTSVMTIDQSSAFDCVNYTLLIEKLRRYNIGNRALEWMKQYLEGRTQYVIIGNGKSRMETVARGVPQGSVLGPLLYAIFVNDISEVAVNRGCSNQVHQDTENLFNKPCNDCGKIVVYADDSTYTIGSRTRDPNKIKLRRTLDDLKLYFDDNELAMNQGKTKLIECMIQQKQGHTTGQPPTLTIEKEPGVEKTIEDSTYVRVLGANVQKNLLWQSHLETGERALFPQVRKQLGRLKHLGELIPLKCRQNLLKGLILSRLSYILPLWGGGSRHLCEQSTSNPNKKPSLVPFFPSSLPFSVTFFTSYCTVLYCTVRKGPGGCLAPHWMQPPGLQDQVDSWLLIGWSCSTRDQQPGQHPLLLPGMNTLAPHWMQPPGLQDQVDSWLLIGWSCSARDQQPGQHPLLLG